jgi:hypothetical protein
MLLGELKTRDEDGRGIATDQSITEHPYRPLQA